MIKNERRKIAYADFSCMGHYSATDLRKGYKSVMRQHGLDCLFLGCKTLVPRSERQHATEQFIKKYRPEAIITFGDSTLFPILNVATRLGLSPPDDIMFVTFGENPCDICGIKIPTLIAPYYEMGVKAVELLHKKIENPDKMLKSCVLNFSVEE